jgi:prophage antirepressor-like protein
VREGKNFRGWILGFVLKTIGKAVLTKALENSVKAIESRYGGVERRDRIAA